MNLPQVRTVDGRWKCWDTRPECWLEAQSLDPDILTVVSPLWGSVFGDPSETTVPLSPKDARSTPIYTNLHTVSGHSWTPSEGFRRNPKGSGLQTWGDIKINWRGLVRKQITKPDPKICWFSSLGTGKGREFSFLTTSQGMLILLVWGVHF